MESVFAGAEVSLIPDEPVFTTACQLQQGYNYPYHLGTYGPGQCALQPPYGITSRSATAGT